MSLLRSLFRMSIQSKLPRLKRTLINPRDGLPVDDAAERLMRVGLARDEYAALDLLDRQQLPVADVIRKLTKPRRANWKRRLLHRLQTMDGSYHHDPHAQEFKALHRGKRTGRNNFM